MKAIKALLSLDVKNTTNTIDAGINITPVSRTNRFHVKKFTSIRVVSVNVNRNAWKMPIVIIIICCRTGDVASDSDTASTTRNTKHTR